MSRLCLTPRRSSRGVTEAAIQRGVASYLRHLASITGAFTFTHPANEGKRSPIQGAILKAAGLQAGEPDIILFLRGGQAAFIELKNGQGSLSLPQRQRHDVLRGLGFDVDVVKARSVPEAIGQVEAIMQRLEIVSNGRIAGKFSGFSG